MNPLVTRAATRPLFALGLGYTPFLVIAAALVVLQSGWRQATVVMAINTALVAVPLGCVWVGHRVLARGRAWWKDRLVGILGGLVPLFLVFTGVAFVLTEASPTMGQQSGLVLTVFPALVTLANLVPLLLGVGLEAAARRLELRRARPEP